MLRITWDRLFDLWRRDPEPVEAMSIFIGLWWSVLLASPGFSFEVSRSYGAMASMADEWVWSVVFCVVWAAQALGLMFGAAFVRRVGVILAASLWCFVAVMLASSAPVTTGVGNYALIAVSQVWAYISTDGFRRDSLWART